ncbi:hypothetical protein IFM89_005910 [Coptis chinensis]|uniref:F-box domain-containing protein n=1 Tax=Coptis chinensis TaxID=261450 RepID=A0A835LV09_9MAGN|nr:hypothetical protein IFM89_005910 [Coptis chinensis]
MKKRKDTLEQVRNWLDLPRDVIILILTKLGLVEILCNAQWVCSLWRKITKDPQLFCSICIPREWKYLSKLALNAYEKLVKESVDRSCGQLVTFSCDFPVTDDLLHYVVDRSNTLKCLRLGACYDISDNGFIGAVRNLPLLEELELWSFYFSKQVIKQVGKFCPKLKYLRLTEKRVRNVWNRNSQVNCNDEAFGIAESMPQLLRLSLFANALGNDGLRAILDGCPRLEYLDLRTCTGINLNGDLLKKCGRIKDLRF